MTASAAQTYLTPEEYIAFERKALPNSEIIRHEYLNGELIAMSGFQELGETLPLISIHCELPLQEIYERVTFPD